MKHEQAISYVIRQGDQVLTVRRPDSDPKIPSIWGLPAGLVSKDETIEQATLRSGVEKLGVKLEIVKAVSSGELYRQHDDTQLTMTLFEAKITDGIPEVPQDYPDVTQYAQWRWASPETLRPAAVGDSLCTRLFLAEHDKAV